jgi:hypothetical protein
VVSYVKKNLQRLLAIFSGGQNNPVQARVSRPSCEDHLAHVEAEFSLAADLVFHVRIGGHQPRIPASVATAAKTFCEPRIGWNDVLEFRHCRLSVAPNRMLRVRFYNCD